ncbi:MAG: hypothetical protein IPO31_04720 [Candidatus Obscuribacter sp.]|nr:hypothetical protein [Candidatus Obscuribacter sp.]
MTTDRSTPSDKAKPDDSQAKSAAELLLSITQRHGANTAAKPESTPSFLSGGIKLAAADSLIAPAKTEPKPATAGSMAHSFSNAAITNLKHQADGMTGMLNTTQTTDAAYQRALRSSTTVQQDSALVSLFKSAGNIATNIDKIPEALKKQGKAYVNDLTSGDGNKVAAALGNTTAILATAFVPIGTASKAGTVSRESSILARGASEIKSVGTDIANYSALRGASQAQDVLGASRVSSIPTRRALEEAAANAATKDAGKAVGHLDDVGGLTRTDKTTASKPGTDASKPAVDTGAKPGGGTAPVVAENTAAHGSAKTGLSGMLDNGTASLTDGAVRADVRVAGSAKPVVESVGQKVVPDAPVAKPGEVQAPVVAKDAPVVTPGEAKAPVVAKDAPVVTPGEAKAPAVAKDAPVAVPVEVKPPVVAKDAPVAAPVEVKPPVVAKDAPVVTPGEAKAPVVAKEVKPQVVAKDAPVAALVEVKPPVVAKDAPVAAPVEVKPPVVAKDAPVATPGEVKPPVVAKDAPVAAPGEVKPPVVAKDAPVATPGEVKPPVVAKDAPVAAPVEVKPPVVAKDAPVVAPVEVKPPVVVKDAPVATPGEVKPPVVAKDAPVAKPGEVQAPVVAKDAPVVTPGEAKAPVVAKDAPVVTPGEAKAPVVAKDAPVVAPVEVKPQVVAKDAPVATPGEVKPPVVAKDAPVATPGEVKPPVVAKDAPVAKAADAPAPVVDKAPATPEVKPQGELRSAAEGKPVTKAADAPVVAAPQSVATQSLDYAALSRGTATRATETVREIGTSVESLTARSVDNVHPELRGAQGAVVKSELSAVETTVKNFTEGRAVETFVPDMRKHIQALENSGATNIARDLTTKVEQFERLSGASRAAQAVDSASVSTGAKAQTLAKVVDDSLRTMPPAQREVANVVSRRLEEISQASVRDPRAVQSLVDDLAKPEYSKFFAQSPELSTAMAQLKRESNVLGTSLAKADTTTVTLERVASSARLTEEGLGASQKVGQISKDFEAGLRPDVPVSAAPVVQRELAAIGKELETIGQTAAESRAIATVRQRVEAISDAGAPKLAQELKNDLAKLETTGLNAERTRLIEQTGMAMQRDGELLGTRASQLQRQLHSEGVSAPSVGSGMPVKSQIARHLDNIAEQSGLVTGATDKVAAAASMRNSLAKIEELGGARVLTPAQAKNLDEIAKLVGNIDRQAVEMRGLATTQRSVTTAGETIPALTTDISRAVKVAGKEDVLAPNLKRIEEAANDLRLAPNAEARAQAASRIAQELENPAMREALDRTARGQFAQAGIAREVKALDEAVLLAQRERATTRLQAVADNAASDVRKAESEIATATKPTKPVSDPAVNPVVESAATPTVRPVVKTEVAAAVESTPSRLASLSDDYSRAIKEASHVEPAIASRRIEQSYQALESEATKAGLTVEQIRQLKADHELVRRSLTEFDQANKALVAAKLNEVEQGFRSLESATSTEAQRSLIKVTYNNIQDLRYLEGAGRGGASTLEAAQTGLMRAKNDIEVATYRSNLVKLAASGDRQAQSQLLVAGLVTDGRRVTSLVPESFAPLSALQSLKMPWQSASPMRNLSATDDFFVNNRGLFLNPRTIMAAKAASTLYYGAREINALSANIDAVKAEQQAQNDKLREPVTFGNNARTVMRNAAAADVVGRSVMSGRPARVEEPILTGNERTSYGVFENDPDKMRKIEYFNRYGTPFVPLRQSAPAAEQPAAPVVRAFSLPLRFNWSGDKANGFDKPANSQFVIPSAMNFASPFALSNSDHGGRRDTVYGAQGSIFGGQSGMTSATGGAKLGADLTAAASMSGYQEGSSGHDIKDLEQVEESESGVDLPGSAPTVMAHAGQAINNQDDEDDDDDTASSSPVSAKPVPPLPASGNVLAGDPVEPAKKTLAGPPRKRTNVIS